MTDGEAGNDNRWQSSGSGPHWARVDFPFPVEVGSAQVFTGLDDTLAQASFSMQYLDGSIWVDAPGAVITGNTDVERNIVFTTPVTASSFRVYSTDGTMRIRELALYPPNGVTGFPLGTDVEIEPRPTAAGRRQRQHRRKLRPARRGRQGEQGLHVADLHGGQPTRWRST